MSSHHLTLTLSCKERGPILLSLPPGEGMRCRVFSQHAFPTDLPDTTLASDLPGGENSRVGPWSFLDLAPEHVILTALFARNGHTYARLWNASDRSTEIKLLAAEAVSLRLEKERTSAWPRMRPWGVQTVRLAAMPVR